MRSKTPTPSAGPARNAAALLALTQAMLEDVPVGLLLVDADGVPLWFNNEGAQVCAVWNHGERRAAALRLNNVSFVVPAPLWATCQTMLTAWTERGVSAAQIVSDHERGLHARVKIQPPANRRARPAFYIQLDYRRPRGDRYRSLSPGSVALLAWLSTQEREVAMRLREGLSTVEIARELRRSPLTIKTQLAAIYRKLEVNSRARVAALLNR